MSHAAMPAARPAAMPAGVPRSAAAVLRLFAQQWSVRILFGLFATSLALRLWLGHYSWVDAALVLALLAYWPLNEWLIHVCILHHKPRQLGRWLWNYRIAQDHRAHHANPWAVQHVFISLHVFPWALPLLLAAAWLITPDAPRMLTLLTTFSLLSLHYEWSHLLAHVGWHPPSAYYARRVREHRLHHFRNERYWWGVSMGLGDRLLGTAPNPASVDRSDSVHDLGLP